MAALTACTALVAALTTGFTVGTYQRAYTQTIGQMCIRDMCSITSMM